MVSQESVAARGDLEQPISHYGLNSIRYHRCAQPWALKPLKTVPKKFGNDRTWNRGYCSASIILCEPLGGECTVDRNQGRLGWSLCSDVAIKINTECMTIADQDPCNRTTSTTPVAALNVGPPDDSPPRLHPAQPGAYASPRLELDQHSSIGAPTRESGHRRGRRKQSGYRQSDIEYQWHVPAAYLYATIGLQTTRRQTFGRLGLRASLGPVDCGMHVAQTHWHKVAVSKEKALRGMLGLEQLLRSSYWTYSASSTSQPWILHKNCSKPSWITSTTQLSEPAP